jgi:hypothetical protein
MAIIRSGSGRRSSFTWQHFCRVPAEGFSVLAERLSEVWSTYIRPQTVIGLNARSWVAIVQDLSDINSEKLKIVDVLSTLQAAAPKQKKHIEEETFLRWTLPRINDRNPDGQPITVQTKIEIARFCYENTSVLYSSCPAIAVEASFIRFDRAMRPVAKGA